MFYKFFFSNSTKYLSAYGNVYMYMSRTTKCHVANSSLFLGHGTCLGKAYGIQSKIHSLIK